MQGTTPSVREGRLQLCLQDESGALVGSCYSMAAPKTRYQYRADFTTDDSIVSQAHARHRYVLRSVAVPFVLGGVA